MLVRDLVGDGLLEGVDLGEHPRLVVVPGGRHGLGVDPSPQNTALENSLFTQHKVKVFLYNQQVTDSLTQSFIKLAEEYNIPVVGVYDS